MMIYVKTSSKKKKKAGWKQREEEYNKWLISHGIDPHSKKGSDPVEPYVPKKDAFRRETPKIPSLPCTFAPCTKPKDKVYTGNMIKGIGTMHKSNAVPIFSNEEAIEISRMRRG